MRNHVRFTLAAAILLLLSSCSSTESTRTDATTTTAERDRKVAISDFEHAFNPSAYDDEIEEIQKQHVIEQEKSAAAHHEDSVIVESEYTQGYRIQIYATRNIDEANAMRQTALQHITQDSLYVVFDPPVYKVRVGDFRSRVEANQKLGEVVGLGFTDAWVVADRIVQRKLVRVQPATQHRP